MATIGTDKNGCKYVQFKAGDNSRRTIRLGEVSKSRAASFKAHIEDLIQAQHLNGRMEKHTIAWLADLDNAMHGKLATVGLVTPRAQTAPKLGNFLAEYFQTLTVKPGTTIAYGQCRQHLLQFFGENRAMRSITPKDAEDWRQSLKVERKLSDATIARRVVSARMFFTRAVEWEIIPKNPFAKVKGGSQVNKSRLFFITREMADKVLAACPNNQWKLLFALSRYGGLRCPSEHLALKWTDVDWERNRITIHSPKTEHHAGGDLRIIPLFPELQPLLLEAFTQAEPGSEYVITHYRDTNQNLRTQLQRIIKKASLKPWPRLFHNLRATRQTELCERWPVHVVCQWIGNSAAIARDHYLQVTDEHFEQAVMSGKSALQNALQHAPEPSTQGTATPENYAENEPVRADANTCELSMGAEGLELSAKSSEKSQVSPERGTNSGTLSGETDLDGLTRALASLTPEDRQRVLREAAAKADPGR